MDIANIVSDEYVAVTPDTRLSKLASEFEDKTVEGVIVQGDDFEGVVTRRQLATSHHKPNQTAGSVVWHVPRLAPDEDVRKAAQLMLDSHTQFLPVFDGSELIGVVTGDAVLEAVKPFLDAATVSDAATMDLVTLAPESSLGEALNQFREHRITHLPVFAEGSVRGILSLYDITDYTVRETTQSRGGDASGTDSYGGSVSSSAGRSRRGGFGAREGERDRVLDLPVRDLMVSPVRSINPEATLESAVEEMFAIKGSALIVTGSPSGIITKTDILDALTWEAEGHRGVQVYGIEYLDMMSYADVVAMVDKFDDRDDQMNVFDAKVHLHEHDETLRGQSLILARIRLYTDRGLFIASGEGFGAKHALNEARDVLERQIRDRKTYGRSKKPRGDEYFEKRFGWLLEEAD